jgi:hypothetical protein
MVETITPVVHGGRTRWAAALALHTVGATAAAGLFGAALGGLGSLLGAPLGRAGLVVVGLVALLYVLRLAGEERIPVPQLRRQVPDWWRTFFGWPVAAVLYGGGLGVGFLTYVGHGTLVVVAAGAALSGRPLVGVLVMAPFGLVRGLSPLVTVRTTTREHARALVDRLASSSDRARRMGNATVLVAVAGSAASSIPTTGGGGWWRAGAATVALAFGWAGIAKIAAHRRWMDTLERHDLSPTVVRVAAPAVPIAELAVPATMMLGYARPAAIGVLGCLIVFSVEAVRTRELDVVAGCGCFGTRTALRPRALLIRNGLLAATAVVVVVAGRDAPVSLPMAPGGDDVVPMALAAGAVVAAAVVAGRARRWLSRGERV